jgi:hypothetical protein
MADGASGAMAVLVQAARPIVLPDLPRRLAAHLAQFRDLLGGATPAWPSRTGGRTASCAR